MDMITGQEVYDAMIFHGCSKKICDKLLAIGKGESQENVDFDKIKDFIPDLTTRETAQYEAFLQKLKTNPIETISERYSIVHDDVYGEMRLHPLIVKIINTRTFQRLREIKQLGTVSFVFPSATGSCLSHAISACFVAGNLIRTIRAAQPEFGLTGVDELCVQIAALCSDLGRGPFAHIFDKVMGAVENRTNTHYAGYPNWAPENMAISMLMHLLPEISNEMKSFGIFDDQYRFIAMYMQISKPTETYLNKYRILYAIVNTSRDIVDFGKFNYLSPVFGPADNFNCEHLFRNIRATSSDGGCLIMDSADYGTLYDLVRMRSVVAKKANNNDECLVVELMFVDALIAADEVFDFYTIKVDIEKGIEKFIDLDDSIYLQILKSDNPKLESAKKILNRVISHDFYTFVGSIELNDARASSQHSIGEEDLFLEYLGLIYPKEAKKDSLIIKVCHNYAEMLFEKVRLNAENGSSILLSEASAAGGGDKAPRRFTMRIYSRENDPLLIEKYIDAFTKWCAMRGVGSPTLKNRNMK